MPTTAGVTPSVAPGDRLGRWSPVVRSALVGGALVVTALAETVLVPGAAPPARAGSALAGIQHQIADARRQLDAVTGQRRISEGLDAQKIQIEAQVREQRILERRLAALAAAEHQFWSVPVTAPGISQRPGSGGGVVLGGGRPAVAVRAAYAELGKPYVWAAAGPDAFDCSGLTQWAWARAGVALDHYTGSQWNEGRHVDRGHLKPGDLIFFGARRRHVGMYVGAGQMIDAPHTGAVVRLEPVRGAAYAGAVRPLG